VHTLLDPFGAPGGPLFRQFAVRLEVDVRQSSAWSAMDPPADRFS